MANFSKIESMVKNENNFQVLAEMAPQIIWSATFDGKMKYFNQFWYEFTGLSEAESLGLNWRNYVHPEDSNVLNNVWQSGINIKKPFHLELRLLDKNNDYKWFLCKAIPNKTGNEEVSEWIGTLTDIQEQKQILGLVKEKAEEFEILADNIKHHVWVESADGEPEYFNKTFFDYTGLNLAKISTDRLKIFHPDELEEIKEAWYASKKAKSNFEYETRIKSKSGDYRWFKIRAVPLKDKDGNVLKWIGTNTDINDNKIFEKQKDDFLNVASHELKTPLTSIKGYVQLISNEFEGMDKETLKLLVDNTAKSVEKLNKLIEDMLDISRIETGHLNEFEMELFSVDEFLKELIVQLQESQNGRIIYESNSDIYINGNKNRLKQVFQNLLSNAVKYSPPDTDISVNVQKKNNYVSISILDHGNGISNENMDRIFERFYRTDSNTLSGLGLGLFISREIVKLHKGQIWVESEVGKGSVFHVELPIANT